MSLGADTRQRGRGIAATEQRRQGGEGHARAQHAEHRQKMVGRVGQMNADDGVGRQSHVAQPRRDGADDPVRRGVVQPQRAAAGEACAVERIDQRGGIGASPGVTAKKLVQRQRGAAR